jgi:hypothetical protein
MTAVLRLSLTVAAAGVFVTLAFAGMAVVPEQAQAHRNGCHAARTCPSDHATYRWRGRIGGVTARWLCVHRFSDERNRTFTRRVRYGGRVYFCKR